MVGVAFDIDSASHVFLKTNPPILVVTVPGSAPTRSYTAWLESTQQPPVQDGVLRLTPKASPPTGTVIQVVSPIQATYQISFEPSFQKVVLVDGGNEITINLQGTVVPPPEEEGTRILAEGLTLPLPLPFPLHPKAVDKLEDIIGMELRVVRPGTFITFDLHFNRLNIFVNKDGQIIRYNVG